MQQSQSGHSRREFLENIGSGIGALATLSMSSILTGCSEERQKGGTRVDELEAGILYANDTKGDAVSNFLSAHPHRIELQPYEKKIHRANGTVDVALQGDMHVAYAGNLSVADEHMDRLRKGLDIATQSTVLALTSGWDAVDQDRTQIETLGGEVYQTVDEAVREEHTGTFQMNGFKVANTNGVLYLHGPYDGKQ